MSLQVGIIAPPWLPVSSASPGSTESMVDRLARGLEDAGCQVVLFATGDATCPVERRWYFPSALGQVEDGRAEMIHVERAYRELAGVDVIHDHTLAGLSRTGIGDRSVPTVVTAHRELTRDLRRQYTEAAVHVMITAVSWSQRRMAPEVPVAAVIHHGLVTAEYPVGGDHKEYVLFMGRMHPHDGAHRAILAARTAGKRIMLTGRVHEPAERRYFTTAVAPLLGEDAVYLGDVTGDTRLALLAGAEALVRPIRRAEPFSLPMVESLACGTPVVTFPDGATREILDHGVTGFVCADDAEMARELSHVADLDRARCRTTVQVRFSVERMVRAYIDVYRRAAGASTVSERARRRRNSRVVPLPIIPGRRSPLRRPITRVQPVAEAMD
ncbi:glycosyltransferase family 4 protein [Phytoactinopolyspora alkaliphila]|uniref:Glycosyltransferase family 4 protein n=1 Tax=Phytoactinopolyspora alkaliphila TaxID=1783498 RepID=A0A6N9YUA6_9ACTN|nr:glycosyltransferase [Phytoactinopolyspora alkaliphila]NED98527.1 glycosyltransferase family 4 protein [Phytoactinopolyspora alkaliphila]